MLNIVIPIVVLNLWDPVMNLSGVPYFIIITFEVNRYGGCIEKCGYPTEALNDGSSKLFERKDKYLAITMVHEGECRHSVLICVARACN
jgi:hypothetical protein